MADEKPPAPEIVPYPAHRYNAQTGEVRTVNSQSEADVLGSDWTDSPTPPAPASPAAAPAPRGSMRNTPDWTFDDEKTKE